MNKSPGVNQELYTCPMPEETRSQPSSLYVEVGRTISKFRKELDLSQSQLAKQVGIGQPLIASIELGTRRVSLEDLLKVCEALHVSVTELLPAPQAPKKPGPRPKLVVAYEKLTQLPEKDQGVILAMIDSLASKTKE